MKCLGRNLDDHCCYIKGKVCPFLEENTEPGYRWSCGLRRKLGCWDKVLADAEYQRVTKNAWAPGVNCRDWPGPPGANDIPCSKCGANS